MRAERKRPPAGGPGKTFGDDRSGEAKDSTPAAVRAFKRELWIILQAGHCLAAGHSLEWDDYDRLHEAHQHVIRVLEATS